MHARTIGSLILGLLLAATLTAAETYTWTGTVDADWFNPGNWEDADEQPGVPDAGDSAVIAAGSVLLTNETAGLASFTMTGGTLTFSNWTTRLRAETVLLDGESALTLPPAFAENQMSNRVWIVCQTFTIETNAVINADYRGFLQNQGEGRGTYQDHMGGGGGGHGGRGAPNGARLSHAGKTYGVASAPVTPGSGGAMGQGMINGGEGGGTVFIDATGAVTVRGEIRADGRTSPVVGGSVNVGGGGSGGSIWIVCNTFQGDAGGLISAAGGDSVHRGGPGGGGRIAVHYNPATQPLPVPGTRFRVAQGTGGNDRRHLAETGTLYLPDSRWLSGTMTEQWDGVHFVIPGFTAWRLDALNLAGRIGFPDVWELRVTNDLAMAANAGLTLLAQPTNALSPEHGVLLDVGGHMEIENGCRMLLISHPTNGAVPRIRVGSMELKTGGLIDAKDRGYQTAAGPGRGEETTAPGSGGSYGGHGAPSYAGWDKRHGVYGVPSAPAEPGSGGGQLDMGGYGGGAILIEADGAVTLRGILDADGQNCFHGHGGGGSGGAIYLQCETLHGDANGWLRARGGNPASWGGGAGGGGRIAVIYDATNQRTLATPNPGMRFSTAPGGTGGTADKVKEPGTLYLTDALFLSETLSASQWDDVRVYVGEADAWAVGSLAVAAKIGFPALRSLRVTNDLTVASGGILTLLSGPTNAVWNDYGMHLDVGGTLTVANGGTMTFVTDLTDGAASYIECNRLVVQDTGLLHGDWTGFDRKGYADGAGTSYGGAGHGGAGGVGASPGVAGQPYGLDHAPLLPGSGNASPTKGSRGGGLIRIGVRDSMIIDGTLRVDGMPPFYGANCGGGAGGGIFLSAGRIVGNGEIYARGGSSGAWHTAPGGGGRIAIWRPFIALSMARRMAEGFALRNPEPYRVVQADWAGLETATILASAGTGSNYPAQDGSVFLGRHMRDTLIILR